MGRKVLPGWFGALFFPHLPGGVRACQDGFMNLESRFLMFGGSRPHLQEEGRTGRGDEVRVVKP